MVEEPPPVRGIVFAASSATRRGPRRSFAAYWRLRAPRTSSTTSRRRARPRTRQALAAGSSWLTRSPALARPRSSLASSRSSRSRPRTRFAEDVVLLDVMTIPRSSAPRGAGARPSTSDLGGSSSAPRAGTLPRARQAPPELVVSRGEPVLKGSRSGSSPASGRACALCSLASLNVPFVVWALPLPAPAAPRELGEEPGRAARQDMPLLDGRGLGTCYRARSGRASRRPESCPTPRRLHGRRSSRSARARRAWPSFELPQPLVEPPQPDDMRSTRMARSSTGTALSEQLLLEPFETRSAWLSPPRISARLREIGTTSRDSVAHRGSTCSRSDVSSRRRPRERITSARARSSAASSRARYALRACLRDPLSCPFDACSSMAPRLARGRMKHRPGLRPSARVDRAAARGPTRRLAPARLRPALARGPAAVVVELPEELGGYLAVVSDTRVVPARLALRRETGRGRCCSWSASTAIAGRRSPAVAAAARRRAAPRPRPRRRRAPGAARGGTVGRAARR